MPIPAAPMTPTKNTAPSPEARALSRGPEFSPVPPPGARAAWSAAGMFFLSVLCGTAAEFAPVFTPGAVLQRDMPVAVWGTGRDGESVTIEINGASATTTVASGHWRATLPPLEATASATLRLRGDNTVELPDVAVGEVWLCSGQSNMEWRLNQCPPLTDALLASADNPAIRQIKIPLRPFAGDPLPPFAWKPFDRASAPYFSAVAYFFAAELQRKLGVTVGLLNCSYGGTPIEAWMRREDLVEAGFQKLLDEHERKLAAWPDAAAYEKAWTDYQAARKEWDAKKKADPSYAAPQPVEPYGCHTKGRPTGLRDAMLALVTPYTIRGAIWYQGENNAGRPDDYAKLLPAFIAGLRSDWARPDLPVFIGQISSPTANWPDEQEGYAPLRDVQRAVALADPHSGLVVTLDHGEKGTVHPINKQPVGERFARLALARTYGREGFAAQSPSASQATYAPGRVTITFTDLPGHLELRDPGIPALELQLPDGSWQQASAKLSDDGRQLLVAAPDSGAPKAVRYAYRNFCPLSIFSDEGLPVSPWRLPVVGTP